MVTPKKPFWQRINKLFLATVILPTTLASLYYGLIASDVYISQSSFVIYNPQSPSVSGISALLQSTGLSSSSSGAYTVRDYMLSRDALHALQRKLDMRAMYSNPKVDPFNRFGGWIWFDTSFEQLFRYYQRMVGDDIDPTSNITTLRTQAYTAQDAQRINAQLLSLSQALINRLNAKANQDAVRFYQQEVDKAEAKVKADAVAMARYRNRAGVFSPEPQAALQSQLISKLQDQLIREQIQLNQMLASTPRNPQIPLLRRGIAGLKREIAEQTKKVVGGRSSLASKSVEYEKLSLDKAFAEKQLAAALTALQQAQVQAQKQQLFLETIATPSLPDEALEPKRLRGVLATLVVGLLLWGVFSVIIGGVKEHHDR